MKKKILTVGLLTATMMTMAACGSKNTATDTAATAVVTEVEEVVNAEIMAETAEEMSKEELKSFAEEVQITVADKDLDALANLSTFPLYVSLKVGEETEIADKEAFLALGADKIFTDKMLKEIAAVDPEEVTVFGIGAILGEDVNIIFQMVDGAPAITNISL